MITKSSFKYPTFRSMLFFCILLITCGAGCTQMQLYLEEDYTEMRELYDVEVGRANQNFTGDFLSASYIIYSDSDGNKRRLSDSDTERILYILGQAKYLPKKDFRLWYEAETLFRRTNISFDKYYEYAFYSQDGEELFTTSIWWLGIIPESEIDEYLISPTRRPDLYLPDILYKELEEITDKYCTFW